MWKSIVLKDLREAFSRVNQKVGFGPLPDKTGIYVVAPPALLDQVLEFLQGMDRQVPQVLIEGIVVEFLQTDLTQFGLNITKAQRANSPRSVSRPVILSPPCYRFSSRKTLLLWVRSGLRSTPSRKNSEPTSSRGPTW